VVRSPHDDNYSYSRFTRHQKRDFFCALTKAVVDEIAKGQQSKWYDYFDFDDSNGSPLPLDWDRNGRAVHELQGLPPTGDTHSHLDFYLENCLGGSSEMSDEEFKAFKIVTTRACDLGIMPMYDLMNHVSLSFICCMSFFAVFQNLHI